MRCIDLMSVGSGTRRHSQVLRYVPLVRAPVTPQYMTVLCHGKGHPVSASDYIGIAIYTRWQTSVVPLFPLLLKVLHRPNPHLANQLIQATALSTSSACCASLA